MAEDTAAGKADAQVKRIAVEVYFLGKDSRIPYGLDPFMYCVSCG